MTWQWMRHGAHGGTNRFPVETVPAMTARGWESCDEPPEDDDTPTAEPAPAAPEQSLPESSVGQPPARSTSARRTSTQE